MVRPRFVALLLMVASPVLAGPLAPPSGPVGETYKTLQQVEPRIPISQATTPGDANSVYRITTPGSYYLTSNLGAQNDKHGIVIAASGVTLDLNGFEMLGLLLPPSASLTAITEGSSGLSNIVVRNGSIRAWGGGGVSLLLSENVLVENVVSSFNVADGIFVSDGTVRNCYSANNGQDGFQGDGTIENCTAFNNSLNGFNWGPGSIVNSMAYDNTEVGFRTVLTRVAGCAAYSNGTSGFESVNRSDIRGCLAWNNGLHGYDGGFDTALVGNNASRNSVDGYRVAGSGSLVQDNRAYDNTGAGFVVSGLDSLVIQNTSHGHAVEFNLGAGVTDGGIINATASGSFFTSNGWSNIEH